LDPHHSQFFFILGIGFYYLIDKTEESIRPRYMETVEESLNDTAHILSASLEEKLPFGSLNKDSLKLICYATLSPIFKNVNRRNFEARIYSLIKKETDLQVYVTDQEGYVIYDTEGYREGLDYSKFNDVYLTLKGKYGARSSKLQEDTKEGALFVAAPIRKNDKIIGVITVIKPKISIVPFIELAKEKFWRISLLVGLSIAIVFTILAYLMFRPIGKLSEYVSGLRNKTRTPFPKIGLKELELLGKEIDSLVGELEGKEYIENYIQTLTHEIKSPLSSILASAELIENHPEKSRQLTDNIHKEGKRIQRIIEQLLSLSSLEGKRFLPLREEVNLKDITKEIFDSLSIELESKQIRYRLTGDDISILGDKQYLTMAIQNLVRNSLDFAKVGDTIEVSILNIEDGSIELTVLDEGMKIPDFALSKISERFFSLPRPDTKHKSSGLGLSIVHQIAELHKAELKIKNRETDGVRATIHFNK